MPSIVFPQIYSLSEHSCKYFGSGSYFEGLVTDNHVIYLAPGCCCGDPPYHLQTHPLSVTTEMFIVYSDCEVVTSTRACNRLVHQDCRLVLLLVNYYYYHCYYYYHHHNL